MFDWLKRMWRRRPRCPKKMDGGIVTVTIELDGKAQVLTDLREVQIATRKVARDLERLLKLVGQIKG